MECSKCHRLKEACDFNTYKKSGVDTPKKLCRACDEVNQASRNLRKDKVNAKRREERQAQREAFEPRVSLRQVDETLIIGREPTEQELTDAMKRFEDEEAGRFCVACKNLMLIPSFDLYVKKGKLELRTKCSECYAKAKHNYEVNREKILERSRKYKKDNKEVLDAKRKEYLKANKEYVQMREKVYWDQNRQRLNEMMADYQKNNVHIRLKNKASSRIRDYIRKSMTTKEYMGCKDMQIVMEWLEFRFVEGMNWNNFGSYWQMDHVLPVKRFNMDDPADVEVCFSWKNLQPLERLANIAKHDKVSKEEVDIHINKLKEFGVVKGIQDEVNDYINKYMTCCTRIMALG